MNYKKTNCVLFSKTSKNESAALKIVTHSGFIETSHLVKYLGVFLSKKTPKFPFLFLVYINDLPNSFNSNVILYGDDSTVICSEKNIHYLNLKCNSEFGSIENWINQNNYLLSL